MAEFLWSLLCRETSIDAETNSLSLFNIVDEIIVPQGMAEEGRTGFAAPFVLVSTWRRSDLSQGETLYMYLTLRAPDGGLHRAPHELIGDMEDGHRCRLMARINGLPFFGEGTYRFVISAKSGESDEEVFVATVPVEVILDQGDSTAPSPPSGQSPTAPQG